MHSDDRNFDVRSFIEITHLCRAEAITMWITPQLPSSVVDVDKVASSLNLKLAD